MHRKAPVLESLFNKNAGLFNSFIEHLQWLLLVAAINRRYSEKYLPQNSKDNMLHNSISVDMKVYGILRNFRTPTFENNFWGCF